MARTQVQAELIATNAISGTIIADNAITATHIATNSISGVLVQDSGIVTTMIAANNVTAAKIVSDGIETRHLHSNVISGLSTVTAASGDFVLIGDTSDSNNLKKALASDFGETDRLPLAGGTMTGNIVMGDDTSIGIGDSAERIEFDGAGDISVLGANLGIGETSPDAPLHITSNTPIIVFDESDASQEYRIGSFGGTFALYDSTDSAYRLAVDGSGKVGIGTTSPSERFQVNHTGVEASSIRSSATNNDAYFAVGNSDMSDFIVLFGGHTANPSSTVGWDDSNNLRFATYQNHTGTFGAERMRIDTDGNLHLGFTGDAWHGDYTALTGPNFSLSTDTAAGASKYVTLAYNAYIDSGNAWTYMNADEASAIQQGNGDILFYTATAGSADATISFTERMRVDEAGFVGIGDTTTYAGGHDAVSRLQLTGGGSVLGIRHSQVTDASHRVVQVFTDNGGTYRGRITINNSSCSFTAASDYRLKENIETLPNGLDRLKQLKPVKFKWKEHDYTSEGFIAHEVQEIYPDAVVGEKDDAVMQSMDYGKITPLLVKAIQEQQTIIDDLKSRIETLEG